jgi:ERCC4-related helicase
LAEDNSSKRFDLPLIWPDKIEPRLYQQSIAEKALEKNTLVVLPTALGKTIISALVAANSISTNSNMRVLVMAPTRPLVLQHHETYVNLLKLPSESLMTLTGKTPSLYRKQIWDGKAKIIFATPQIVRNDLESEIFSLRNFNLLIFDECHRARKDYAYTYVAKKYVEQAQWPIILGMTASPGADKEKITEICEALFIEQIEYRSEEDPDVASYIHQVDVEWKSVDLPVEYRETSRVIRIMLNERLTRLARFGVIHTKPENTNRRDLLEAGEQLRRRLPRTIKEWKGPIFNAIIAQSASLTLFHALELLETQGIATLTSFLQKMEKQSEAKKSYKTIINDANYEGLKQLLDHNRNLEHPKLPLLKTLVEDQIRQHPSSKVLVFTQYRDTASHLVQKLRQINRLRVERFVGQASKDDDQGLSQEEQTKIIRDYRDGDTNVLVATCVAEEGLDIPSVDLVVFYEPIPSEIRYIQRKGRTGRKTTGRAVILAANDTFDIAYLHASRRRVERMMKIIASLNLELKPLTRSGTKPEFDPTTRNWIEDAESD